MDNKLNELLNIKKKSEASVEKKKSFTELLCKEFSRQGIIEDTLNILDKGFSFEGSKALALYINSLKEKEKVDAVKILFKTKIFRNNNKGIAFKILISLLSELLYKFDSNNNEIIKTIILSIPRYIYNKEGKKFGDIDVTIKKYFIQTFDPETNIPNFKQLEIDNEVIFQFAKIFIQTTNEIKSFTKKEEQIVNKILKSINLETDSAIKSSTKSNLSEAKNKKKNDKLILNKNNNQKNDNKKDDKLKTKAKVNNFKILELENKISELKLNSETYIRENEDLNKKLQNTYKELETSQKYNEELLQICNSLQNDLKKHKDILNIFEKNAQDAQKELLNSIASKLKCEYMDFNSAKNIPMTIELGENLRDQIITIFQLLEKNGISFVKYFEIEKEEL